MKRPPGVTASAVVAIVGSVLVLLLAVGFITASSGPLPAEPGMPSIPNVAAVARGMGFITAAFAALGLATAWGLLKLHPWARVSILVFAGILVLVALTGIAVMTAMPLPASATADPRMVRLIRPTMIALYAIPLAIGVWWLVQFNRRATREAFEGVLDASAPSGRPLSLSIIGWYLVLGGALCIVPAMSGLPVMLFGAMLTGWTATLVYVLYAALQLTAGTGVLRQQEPARLLAIAWFVLSAASLMLMAWRPGVRESFEAYERSLGAPAPGQSPFDTIEFVRRMTMVWVLMFAVPIWFLVRRRDAFHGRG